MALDMQQLIEREDCSDFMVKARQRAVRQALKRYKCGESTPEEREILVEAMSKYKAAALEENKTRIYNVLLAFYFADNPLGTELMPVRFHINKRTVFKDIQRGIEDLTVILYGVQGIVLMPEEDSPAFVKARMQETITKRLTEEFGKEVRNECRAFIMESH